MDTNQEVTNALQDGIVKSEEEWRAILTEKEYKILRLKATERNESGEYNKHYPKSGYYSCKGCDFPLYSFAAKYDSGCGWPAYNKCFFTKQYHCHVGFVITHKNVANEANYDSIETEIICKQCSGHLGHIYYNELSSGTERHCVNSASVRYKETPNPEEEEKLLNKYGFRFGDLKDGQVADEAIIAIHDEFGKNALFASSDFHNMTDAQKLQKDKELHELGLFI